MESRAMSKPKCHPVKRVLKEEGKTWLMVGVIVIVYLILMGD